jgi:hypothetical protein
MTQDQKIIWAAGFFDGEGTVAVCRQNHKRYNPSYVLMIEFQKKLVVWNRDYGRRGYPAEVNRARENYHERMRVLNQRGVSDENPNPKKPGPRPGNGRNRLTVNRKSDEKEIQTIN